MATNADIGGLTWWKETYFSEKNGWKEIEIWAPYIERVYSKKGEFWGNISG
jgi:hypothetical protein